MKPITLMTGPELADELGAVLADKDDLARREKELKARLIGEFGPGAYDGALFRATVSDPATRSKIDWRAIAEYLEPSRQLVTAHTSEVRVAPAVRVKARLAARKAA